MHEYHKIGGVLTIVSGGIGIAIGIVVAGLIIFIGLIARSDADFQDMPRDFWAMLAAIYGMMALFYVLIGILAIVGGVYALKKKHWGLALAGAIASSLTFYVCGIMALIFVALSKNEFAPSTPAVNLVTPVQAPVSPLSPPVG